MLLNSTLIENKFAIANFILLNEQYVQITRDQLYVVQIIEQYQMQFNSAVDFDKLEGLISISIGSFKLILQELMSKNFVSSTIKKIGNKNTLFYKTKSFWLAAAEKLCEYDSFLTKENKVQKIIELIQEKFNRYLNSQEIIQVEFLVDEYDLDILSEIIAQCQVLDSMYVSTIKDLIAMYKENNLNTVDEIRLQFEEFNR